MRNFLERCILKKRVFQDKINLGKTDKSFLCESRVPVKNELQQEEERKRQEDLEKLRSLRPIDDEFMRCIFRDNIPLAQMVLRIVTGKNDLEITKLEIQKDMKRLVGARSVCLDAYGNDTEGKKYDLEVQRANSGAGKHRARYYSSSMDIENLDAGQEFEELPDTYAIFITEHDIFGEGKAFYPVERVNMTTGEMFEDGEHILYVNGTYRDDTDIGKLMHDFFCCNPEDMNFDLMKDVTRYYKESPKGVETMGNVFDEIRSEAVERASIEYIRSLMETFKLTAQQAMEALRIPAEEQSKYAAKL